jgi:hypothetical protein
MRSGRVALFAVLAFGLIALIAVAVVKRTSTAFTLGVVSTAPVVTLQAGQEACQLPIDVPSGGSFDRVAFRLGTFGAAHGPRLQVAVRDLAGTALARGTLSAGYPDITTRPVERVRLNRKVEPGRISVCLIDLERRKVAVYGGADAAARTSTAFVDGQPVSSDLELVFERDGRSLAALVPDMFRRAALFGFSWEGAWMYWLLGLAVLVCGPLLLWRALESAARDQRPGDHPAA